MNENDVLGFDPQDLFKEESKVNRSNSGASYMYYTRPAEAKSDDGIYRATIKVIYNPCNLRESFLDQQMYSLTDENGWFNVVSSLTVNDKNCPIFKAWKQCRYAEQGSDLWKQQAKEKDGGKDLFQRRTARYVLVQILEDKNQPDLEGAFKIWKLPSSIYDLIKQKQDPTDKKKYPIPVMDFLFGRAIDIEVHPGPDDKANPSRKTREISYTGELSEDTVCCVNPDGSPLLTSDEQEVLDNYVEAISKVWKMKANSDEEIERRKAMKAAVDAEPNTAELRQIYARVLEQIKGWAPKLDTVSYHEWTPEVKTRVERWINTVLACQNPAVQTINETATTEATTEATSATKPEPASAADVFAPAASDDSDLPF